MKPRFKSENKPLCDDRRGRRASIRQSGKLLSYREVLELWQHDEEFRCYFSSILSEVPFSAYRWETPALTKETVDCPFEFVVIDSPALSSIPDRSAFADYFYSGKETEESIRVFSNLGEDALLVVPCPIADIVVYSHLACFLRGAPDDQIHDLWRSVGRCLEQNLSQRAIWLNTAGDGVAWLHVRLDSRPKYYEYSPYKSLRKILRSTPSR